MAKSKGYEDNRNALAAMIKKEPVSPTPIQEVRPIETKTETEELARISGFWVPVELARKIKVHSAQTDKSIREISIEAYEMYFSQFTQINS